MNTVKKQSLMPFTDVNTITGLYFTFLCKVYHNLENKIHLLCKIRQHLIISGQNSDCIRLFPYHSIRIKDPGWNITLVGCQPEAIPVS